MTAEPSFTPLTYDPDSGEITDFLGEHVALVYEHDALGFRLAAAPELYEALELIFDQSGCDCDSAYLGQAWDAPSHASDCPVYERWAAHEPKARAALAHARGEVSV